MTSAGHCGDVGSNWISPGSNQTIGYFKYRNNGPRDIALIGDRSYAPVIYTGDATGTASTVKGAANPVLSRAIYCYSGGQTNEKCGLTVTDMSIAPCYDGACHTNQMSFSQVSDCPADVGDSGAPFYLDFSFGGYPSIRGMQTAFVEDQFHHHLFCIGEIWSYMSSYYGLTIVSG
jgi:hypothetical protein